MSQTDAEPSSRLLRAAVAEREGLARQRRRLREARSKVLAELQRIDEAMSTLDERELLLERLAPIPPGSSSLARIADPGALTATTAQRPPPAPSAVESPRGEPRGGEGAESALVLRGPSIRETAVRLLIARGGIEALHYRAWFQMLADAGYTVAGKDPLAVFLTQISRSPLVRKSTQSGVYELDVDAPGRLRRKIAHLHAELRDLTTHSSDTADLREIRVRRKELTATIGHAESALEEAELMLSASETRQMGETPTLARAS
jgi:hypothetical protein